MLHHNPSNFTLIFLHKYSFNPSAESNCNFLITFRFNYRQGNPLLSAHLPPAINNYFVIINHTP